MHLRSGASDGLTRARHRFIDGLVGERDWANPEISRRRRPMILLPVAGLFVDHCGRHWPTCAAPRRFADRFPWSHTDVAVVRCAERGEPGTLQLIRSAALVRRVFHHHLSQRRQARGGDQPAGGVGCDRPPLGLTTQKEWNQHGSPTDTFQRQIHQRTQHCTRQDANGL